MVIKGESEMSITEISGQIKARIFMLGGKASTEEQLNYCIEKALQQAAEYCNLSGAEYFPKDAKFGLIEYAASVYLLETASCNPLYEDMRRDAKASLLGFRKVRW
jgi:hypothetical protein